MESDLISRSALLKKKTYLWDEAIGTEGCVLVEDIENAPAVDAEPVRHGEWEEYPDSVHIRCKKCKLEFHVDRMPKTRNYCPNCGAKMVGGKHAD